MNDFYNDEEYKIELDEEDLKEEEELKKEENNTSFSINLPSKKNNYFDEERMVELVFDNPFEYNRKVNLKRFNSMTLNDFSLGPIEHRECLIIRKLDN